MTEQERWGGDGLGPEDMAIPEIKLVQHVGGADAKAAGALPGDFYCSLTDEVFKGNEGFEMVIVAMQKNRTYWGRDDIDDEPPECASLQVTAAGGRSQNGDDCSVCEHRNDAPWLLSASERRSKCLLNYNLLGITIADGMPVLLRATGISSAPTKELYTQLSLNKQLAGAWYKAKTRVTSLPKKTPSGDVFAIKFGKLEPATVGKNEAQLEEYRVLSLQLIGIKMLPEGRETEEATDPVPAEPKQVAAPEPVVEPPILEGPAKAEVKPVEEKAEAKAKPIDMDF